MHQTELQELVKQVSLEYFSRPFIHEATFNPRLKSTGGRYLLRTHNLEFNRRVLDLYGIDELIGVIKHELCHYHLHLENKGYQHKDKDFKELLLMTGGSRFVKDLRNEIEKEKFLLYYCKDCGQALSRKRKIDTKKYVCGKCRGKLRLVN